MKRIVIVGAGRWARAMHLPALQRLRDAGRAEYAAVCDLDPQKARSYAATLGAEAHADVEAMLTRVRPDGVALLAPPDAAPALIGKCIERGLPFLTEKPPAPDAETHRRLLGRVGDLPHVVAYNRRHAPYIRQALEWMDGAPLQAVFCDFSRFNRTDADFGTTLVHGVDTVQCLAREEFGEARLEVAPAGETANFYVSGWTASGVRLEVRITPTTGSAHERYVVASRERTVVVAYPQPSMIDLPGGVERHERNCVADRKTAADFGLAPDDLPGLGGIVREHELFVEMLEGRAAAWSTLRTSLPAQLIRDALAAMVRAGGRQSRELRLTNPQSPGSGASGRIRRGRAT